ncbi:cytochrome c biogenesis protein CcsA [Candidatus Desantisbacteria bacterium]|nr:cytochrome c biogenesis protein CcsA [Candidatus Desantisbacteria bacterium]
MLMSFPFLLTIVIAIYISTSLISLIFFVSPNKTLLKIYNSTLIFAFIFHTIILVIRTILLGHAPMASLFDSLLFYTWSVSLTASVMYLRYKEQTLALFVVMPVLLALVKANQVSQEIRELSPSLQTLWFETHVGTSFIAYGLFTLGFSAGFLYLLKSRDKARICRFISPLPVIEKLVYRSCAWGFFMFTIAMTCGGIWAYLAWCNYFIWTPKELFSVILWLYYSLYLHARYTSGWQGKRSAYFACGGFFLMIFTYLGISLLMRSSHSF